MNTIEKWSTTATIHDLDRRELWSEVFPGATVPIVSPIALRVNVPERGECLAYMLDLAALSQEQLEGVIALIAKRFKIPILEVRQEIGLGVPILAEGVSVSIRSDEKQEVEQIDLDQRIRDIAERKIIWCFNCQCFVKREELKIWSGDDSRHFLCPGCDADLEPAQDLEDYYDEP